MKKIIIIVIILIVLLAGYLFWQFKKLENSPIYPYNFKINLKDNKINGLVAFQIENQADIDFEITSFDLRLVLNDVEVSRGQEKKSIPFIKGENTIIEIPFTTNLLGFKGFDLAKFITVTVQAQAVDVRIIGTITVSKGFIKKAIPIDYLIKNFKKN